MPLWNIYHTSNAFSIEEKSELAERITNIVYPHLPSFYVGVVFQEASEKDFFIGGTPAENFVRISIDHIARTLPTPVWKADWRRRAKEALEPMFSSRGFRWELHVDETPREIWLIQGMVPPLPNTPAEKKWHADNHPSDFVEDNSVES